MAKVIERYESDGETLAQETYDEGTVLDGATTTPRRAWWKNASTGAEVFESCKFAIEQVGANDGDDFVQIAPDSPLAPPGACTATKAAGIALEIGYYEWAITFVTANGETIAGARSDETTTSGNQKVNLTAIPTGPAGTTARKIYRTVVGGAGDLKLVGTIPDNVTTSFLDDVPDGSLGAVVPSLNTSGSAGTWQTGDINIGNVAVGEFNACWMRFNVPGGTSQVGNPRRADVTFIETGA